MSTLIFLLIGLVYKCCCKVDQGLVEVEDIVVIESLKPFFATLKNKDREFWFTEEKTCRERICLKRISDKNYLNLIFAKPNTTSRRLRSVHNYDILANPIYSDRFLYVPCSYEQRHEYVISEYEDPWMRNYTSDIVRLACDLAYLPKSIAKSLVFDEEHIQSLMKVQIDKDGQEEDGMNEGPRGYSTVVSDVSYTQQTSQTTQMNLLD